MAFLLRAISGGSNSFREKIKDAEDVNKTFQAELVCCIPLALIPFLNAGDDHKNAERLIVYLWILCKMVLRLRTLSADHVVIMPDICA
jgi:hypothetical protein